MRKVWIVSIGVLAVLALGCAVDSGGGDGGGSSTVSGSSSAVEDDSFTGISINNDVIDSVFNDSARSFFFCGTEDPDDGTKGQLSGQFIDFQRSGRLAQTTAATAEISVFFHVISRGDSREDGEVPDSDLIIQLDAMNRAFSGAAGGVRTGFQFRLAGINRVRRPEWFNLGLGSEEEIDMKQTLQQGGPETLNIYTTTIDSSTFAEGEVGTVLGYSSLPVFYPLIPFFDGIVMNHNALPGGSADRYNTGGVLVHEAGHWMGLLHTFEGECDGTFDDLVQDTPREKIPTRGNFCPVNQDTCESEGVDPIHNHMTYTEDDCRFEFSPGQVEFMRFNALIFRLLFPEQ